MIDMIHGDCMEIMKQYPDKYFQLSCVDPPYGIQKGNLTGFKRKTIQHEQSEKCSEWDTRPDSSYFKELFRVSKNQIIWGMQYFVADLPDFSQPIIWDKKTGDNYFADAELAYCSIPGTARIFTHQWCGAFKDSERGEKAVHVNQKPVALYKWLLSRYAKPGDRILDTHGGSGSICIACHDLGYDLTWIEKDADYYEAACKRYKDHAAQETLFAPDTLRQPVQAELI
jgi:site-specific DNA-methyltransferase (adenine-specific)